MFVYSYVSELPVQNKKLAKNIWKIFGEKVQKNFQNESFKNFKIFFFWSKKQKFFGTKKENSKFWGKKGKKLEKNSKIGENLFFSFWGKR